MGLCLEHQYRAIKSRGNPAWKLYVQEAYSAISFIFFSGRILTCVLAGLALNIISSPVNGLVPLRAFLAGFFQIGFGFIFITIGSQTTPAATVGILMLTESVFGPFWAWFFINETPPIFVLLGGGMIIFSILFETFYNKKSSK